MRVENWAFPVSVRSPRLKLREEGVYESRGYSTVLALILSVVMTPSTFF